MLEYVNRLWDILNDAIIIVSKNSSHQGNANKKHNSMPLNTHQNGCNKKSRWYKVMAKMRGKNNSPTLLAGVQIGTADWENCLALSTRAEHMCILWTSDSTSRYIHNRHVYLSPSKNMHENAYCRTIVMPKYWPDHKCPSTLDG